VDRWSLGRLLVESGRSPQAPEAQDQNLDWGFQRSLFHLLERFCGGTLEWKRNALEMSRREPAASAALTRFLPPSRRALLFASLIPADSR
jgi:hypothetical protein